MDKKLLFEQSPSPMFIYDREKLAVIKANNCFAELLGYTKKQLEESELSLKALHPSQQWSRALRFYKKWAVTNFDKCDIWPVLDKKSELHYVKMVSQNLNGSTQQLVTLKNVTKFLKAAQKDQKAFKELSYHVQNTSLAWIEWDENFCITKWSKRAEEISGFTREQVLSRTPFFFTFPDVDSQKRIKESLQSMMSGNIDRDELEVKLKHKTGETLQLKIHSSALRDSNGQLISILTLVEDLTALKKSREELRKSEKLFKKLFTNAPQSMVMVDGKNNIRRVNNSFENLFGYTQKELAGRNLDKVVIENEADGGDIRKMAIGVKEEGKIYTELKRYTKQGRELDVVVGGIPVYLDDKLIAGFGIYIDITGQKEIQRKLEQSLNEKQVLLEEVHHRVKNNLAVVSGLLQMQTMHVDDERLRRYIQNSQLRIRSMAIVHEMLYKSRSLSAVNMKHYVEKLVEIIARTLGPEQKEISTQVQSDEIELTINQAIPAALTISELITNAYEYAFEGRSEGLVSVHLHRIKDVITISVSDDGIGLPDNFEEMRKTSLGLSLIDNLCKQLETEIEIQSDTSGTSFKFTFQQAQTRGSSSSNRLNEMQ